MTNSLLSAENHPKRTLQVGADADGAARLCAVAIADALTPPPSTSSTRPHRTIAFSGGTTPARMFGHLAGLIATDGGSWWSAVEVLQVDERIAPAGDPARNANDLTSLLLDPTTTPAERRHLMPVEEPHAEDAASHYAATVSRLAPNGLDLVVLGLGDDGHTASLVPGDAVVSERSALVSATGIYKGHRRLTLTRPCIDRAKLVIWLVSGASKASALARLVANDPTIPAGLIATPNQVLITDKAATALLPRRAG